MPDVPDTVTEAVAFLQANGYEDEFVPTCRAIEQAGDKVEEVRVDHSFRFEGESDPGDEAIVLGVSWPSGRKAIFASAYGHDADPDEARFLAALPR